MRKKRVAYISGLRDSRKMQEAERFLETMGYKSINPMMLVEMHPAWSWMDLREMRIEAVESCDLIFMTEGWEKCPEAVDEWEAARLGERVIPVSYPEHRK